ncbi:hypothetical protein TcWFU_006728 [Taenia crassiceps]|uniref:Uncharacterized protein n=1 Tax=Taenia crassiceps TaxID=6207 RepID=A0ABR4Q308_9CEST
MRSEVCRVDTLATGQVLPPVTVDLGSKLQASRNEISRVDAHTKHTDCNDVSTISQCLLPVLAGVPSNLAELRQVKTGNMKSDTFHGEQLVVQSVVRIRISVKRKAVPKVVTGWLRSTPPLTSVLQY